MKDMLVSFKGSYSIVLVLIGLSLFLLFIDSKITNKKITSNEYIKVGLLTGVIAIICVYINTLKGSVQEIMHVGPAPF